MVLLGKMIGYIGNFILPGYPINFLSFYNHKILDFFRFIRYFCTYMYKKLVVQNVPLYLKSSSQETDASVVHKALCVGMCVCVTGLHIKR